MTGAGPGSGLLAGRVVLVSGAGPGLGRAVAATVLREGGSAVLGDRLPSVVDVASGVDPGGARTVTCVADITVPDDCAAAVGAAVERFGRLDGVVHVAAFDAATGGLLDGGLDAWEAAAAVNVRGTLQLTRAAVPALSADGGGAVVVIGAGAATTPDAAFPMLSYAASKGALVTAAWHLAHELGPLGVTVNTVHPVYKWGVVLEAALRRRVAETGEDLDDLVAGLAARVPLRRLATDDDVANAAAFFCSPLARSITGQTLYVDGGQVLH